MSPPYEIIVCSGIIWVGINHFLQTKRFPMIVCKI
jgi:uncharacterized membrane protein